jgi:alpha-galactosidase
VARNVEHLRDPGKNEDREVIPWFLIQRTNASQDGWYVGIEFSGRTRLAIARKGGSLRGAAGLNPTPGAFRTRVSAGESFETPTVFVGGFRDGPDGAGNVLRAWVREVLNNPATWKNSNYPLLANNSWGSGMAVDETLAHRMIRESTDLGFEMFHIDAGWFRGVGDWYASAEKFPHGLVEIADDAHRHGLKFGLWVDWTQAALDTEPGALNVRDPQVRNWLVADVLDDWKPEPFKGQTIENTASPSRSFRFISRRCGHLCAMGRFSMFRCGPTACSGTGWNITMRVRGRVSSMRSAAQPKRSRTTDTHSED